MNSGGSKNPKSLRALVISTAVQAFLSWCIFIFPPIAVVVAPELGLDPITVGWQTGLVFVTHVIATLYSGAVLTHLGAVRSLQVALVASLLGVLLCVVPSIASLVVASVLFGASHSLVNPATAMILRRVASVKRNGLIFSIKQASVPLGFMASSLVGTTVAEYFDWRWSLLPLALALVYLTYATHSLQGIYGERPIERHKGLLRIPVNALKSVLGNRVLLLCAGGAVCFGMTQNMVVAFSGNMFVDEFDRSLIFAGFILTCVNLGAVVGRLAWGQIADMLGKPGQVLRVLGLLIAGLGLLVIALPNSAPQLAWASLFALIGATAIGWNGLMMAELSRRCGDGNVEQQMAGAFFLMFSSGFLGPTIFISAHSFFDSYALTMALTVCLFGLLGAGMFHLSLIEERAN